jgi:hypothetical protein
MKSPKHQQIYKELLRAIAEGEYVEGQRLPSEADLVTRFDTSRPTLGELGIGIPNGVRIVGIDDVRYAELLRVPLTTLRQPYQYIGAAALQAMLERIAHPDMPARDIVLECKLIVRESCGAGLK